MPRAIRVLHAVAVMAVAFAVGTQHVGDAVVQVVDSSSFTQRQHAAAAQRVGGAIGAGGVDHRTSEHPLLAHRGDDVQGKGAGIPPGVLLAVGAPPGNCSDSCVEPQVRSDGWVGRQRFQVVAN